MYIVLCWWGWPLIIRFRICITRILNICSIASIHAFTMIPSLTASTTCKVLLFELKELHSIPAINFRLQTTYSFKTTSSTITSWHFHIACIGIIHMLIGCISYPFNFTVLRLFMAHARVSRFVHCYYGTGSIVSISMYQSWWFVVMYYWTACWTWMRYDTDDANHMTWAWLWSNKLQISLHACIRFLFPKAVVYFSVTAKNIASVRYCACNVSNYS